MQNLPIRVVRGVLRRLHRAVRRIGFDVVSHRSAFDDQKKLVRTNRPVIFDLGAHRGQSAVSYCRAFPQATIYSFEPFPDNYAQLQQVAERHQSIHPINAAVSDAVGTATLLATEQSQSNSLLPRSEAARKYLTASMYDVSPFEVSTVTLDDFVHRNEIAHIDILKMDIQGAELRALRGAETILHRGSIDHIFCEVSYLHRYENEPLFCDINSFLIGHGFSLFALYAPRHADDGQLLFCDALFVHDRVRGSVLNARGGSSPMRSLRHRRV